MKLVAGFAAVALASLALPADASIIVCVKTVSPESTLETPLVTYYLRNDAARPIGDGERHLWKETNLVEGLQIWDQSFGGVGCVNGASPDERGPVVPRPPAL